VRVKVIEADEKGRVRLSMKAAAEEDAQNGRAPQAAPAAAQPAAPEAPPMGIAE
jgi:polyribonucleotide nucleotidyltransferase